MAMSLKIAYIDGWFNVNSICLGGVLSLRFSEAHSILHFAAYARYAVEDLFLRRRGFFVVTIECVDVECFEQNGDEEIEDHKVSDKCDEQEKRDTCGRVG
jgi:hypothetical protein